MGLALLPTTTCTTFPPSIAMATFLPPSYQTHHLRSPLIVSPTLRLLPPRSSSSLPPIPSSCPRLPRLRHPPLPSLLLPRGLGSPLRHCQARAFSDASANAPESQPQENVVKEAAHLALSLGTFLALDNLLKKAFAAAAIRFPSALFGMFSIFSLLLALDFLKPEAASGVIDFFAPATLFIQRWLPLFYVPSLVVLPLAVKGIPAASAAKIGAILAGGWVLSLAVAGYTALIVRKIVKTEMIPAEPMAKPAPFSNSEIWAWTAILLGSFTLAILSPTALGTVPLTTLPFFLAATVLGYIVGTSLPPFIKKVFHPIIACAAAADLAAFAFGKFSGSGFESSLGAYLTKQGGNIGAGDLLMGFLGSVILSFAFSMFKQRKLVKRHAAEIFSAVIVASVFSLYSTAAVGRLSGLEPSLTIAIVPRCITVALALSIANLFEVTNTSLTAAVVVLTGLVGANFAQTLMDRLGLTDPIARGMATASSAHGLGTAALSAKEPEALPFCAIAYALTGIFCSVLCCVPIVRQSLLAIVGF